LIAGSSPELLRGLAVPAPTPVIAAPGPPERGRGA